MAASLVAALTIIGFVIAGRIWMAIDLGKDSIFLGLAALIIPLVGLAVSFRDRGPSLRGAMTLVSGFAQIVPLGLAVLLFAPDSSGQSAFGPRASSPAMDPDSWADLIVKSEASLKNDTPTVTVNGRITSRRPDSVEDLAARGDALLSRFRSYETGSLVVDVSERRLTLRYRGEARHRNAYLYYVGLSTNNFVRAE